MGEKSFKKTLEKVPFNSQLELIDQALHNYSRTQASYTNGNGNKHTGYSYSHHNNTQQQHAQHKYTLAAVAAAAAVQHQQQQSFILQQQQSQQSQQLQQHQHQHQHQNKHQLINNALNSQQQPSFYRQPQQHQSGDFHSRSYYGSDPAMNSSFHDISSYQKPYDFRSSVMSVNGSNNSVTNSPLPVDLMKTTSFTSGENSISPIVLQPQHSANSLRSSPPAMLLSTTSPAPASQFLSSGMSTHNQWSAGRQSIWSPNGNSSTISSSQPEGFGTLW